MTQLARNTDPHTSHDAAQLALDFVASHEAKIYAAICGADGLNYREIAFIAKLEPVAVARRLKAMERRKLIERREASYAELTARIYVPRATIYKQRDGMALWFRT